MAPPEIIITAPMRSDVVEALDQAFTLHRLWDQADVEGFLREVGPRVRGVATGAQFGYLDGAFMDRLPALEIISSFGVGYDNVDADAAADRGIIVTNTPGVLDDEVADLTIGLLIATIRQIPLADRFLRQGNWLERPFPLSATLRGRRIGIVGLGQIGVAIGRRLEGFGVEIAYHTRQRRHASPYAYHATLAGLAEASDTLIIIVPGGPATRKLIDAKILGALGPQGIVINVARGSVVDESALIEALNSGTILAAGLDVFEDEPRVPQQLIDMPQVVLLPHVGSASFHTRDAMGKLMTDNLISWFADGRPLTPVSETAHLIKRPGLMNCSDA